MRVFALSSASFCGQQRDYFPSFRSRTYRRSFQDTDTGDPDHTDHTDDSHDPRSKPISGSDLKVNV